MEDSTPASRRELEGKARSAEVRLAGSEGNGRKGIAKEESHPL